jgi:hypothetical protein
VIGKGTRLEEEGRDDGNDSVQLVCRGARHVDCTTYRNVRTGIQGKD